MAREGSLTLDDLPPDVRPRLEPLVANATVYELSRLDPLSAATVDQYYLTALTSTRLVKAFIGRGADGGIRENVNAYALSSIANVAIVPGEEEGERAEILVELAGESFSTGVPVEIARAIIGSS